MKFQLKFQQGDKLSTVAVQMYACTQYNHNLESGPKAEGEKGCLEYFE